MPRRRRLPPDTRPSWRDPAVPVLRRYAFANGVIKTDIDPDYEQRYRAYLLSAADTPTYDRDPTYHMRKTK